jgi:hypothetical protein
VNVGSNLREFQVMQLKILVLFFSIFFLFKSFGQTTYACFENDKNKKLRLWVSFDGQEKAKYVKYDGQKDSIKLVYSNITKSENPGGIPAVYWAETYLEKYHGKVTGEYTFTNAGTHQLDATYTRKKDNKEFYFQIIETEVDPIFGVHRSKPCF